MGGWYTQGFSEDYVNARGIPRVEFVDDVAAFLKKKDCNPEGAIKVMQEQYSKYKLMEYKLGQNKASLLRKLPEIKKTLEMVKHLKAKVEADEELRTHFGLSDTVFVEAVVKDKPQTVGIWLGANVMVEYTQDEAIELLKKNLDTASANLERTVEDLAFLRDQLTVSEVNIARVYNWEVKQKRKAKEAGAGEAETDTKTVE
jgi:prefoldin subunit 5